jgi:hypothetical protein
MFMFVRFVWLHRRADASIVAEARRAAPIRRWSKKRFDNLVWLGDILGDVPSNGLRTTVKSQDLLQKPQGATLTRE